MVSQEYQVASVEASDAEEGEAMSGEPRSKPTLGDFVAFCLKHPELRFWQALHAWTRADKIWLENMDGTHDTFHWTGRVWDKR